MNHVAHLFAHYGDILLQILDLIDTLGFQILD
jgi:hypothetical protein